MCHFMSESEPSAINVEGDKSRQGLAISHGIEAVIDIAWEASQERRTVSLVGSNATLRIDFDIHDRVFFIAEEKRKKYSASLENLLLNQLMYMISSINNFNSGKSWSPMPIVSAALEG